MKSGILIIGSLLWDKNQGSHINLRQKWRNKRLQMNKKIHVFAPIRYGRKSNGSYTMVFSKQAELDDNYGTAYFVPFKNSINSFTGLKNQAEYLSNAEGANDKKFVKGNKEKWCVIGILFNPNFDNEKKQRIITLFQQKLNSDGLGNEYTKFCIPNEPSILTNQGELDINWLNAVNPKDQKELNTYDFIIAACPQQNEKSYPTPDSIREGVLIDIRDYFYSNIRSGITTYQDRGIINS